MPDDSLVPLLAPPLLQRLAQRERLAPGILAHGPGSIVYGALSGLEALAGRLVACGRAGEDALRRVLDALFGTLNAVVEEHGGSVLHFSDEHFVAALRPAGPHQPGRAADDVERAFACALALQARLQRFLAVEGPLISGQLLDAPGGTSIISALRLGVGSGEYAESYVVDKTAGGQYFVAGTAVDEAIAAHAVARPGEVIAGSGALRLALGMAELGLRTQYGLIAGTPSLEALGGLEPALLPVPPAGALAPCVPSALRARAASADGLRGAAQLAAVVAVRWPAPPPHEALCGYVAAALPLAAQGDGWIVEVLAGGDETGLLVFFGTPEAGKDLQAQALRCAQGLREGMPDARIALATGPVFAGAFGSGRRQCFLAIGAPMREARRLAAQAAPGLVWLAAPDAEHAQAFM